MMLMIMTDYSFQYMEMRIREIFELSDTKRIES